jgi:signal transduction histidine kinase
MVASENREPRTENRELRTDPPSTRFAPLRQPGGVAIEALPETAEDKAVTHEELIRFFYVLSHDLKSPIFAVDGFSELLLGDYDEKLDEDGRDFLHRIRSSAQYMKRILDDMSQMIRLLARPNVRKAASMGEIVEEVALKHNLAIEEGGVSIDVSPDLPVLNVDPEKIREAMGGLFANALFFTDRPKGERRIVVDSTSDGTSHRICVRDNGTGIDPRYISSIFELGGLSKLDKSRGGGPGYGLYMAKRLIESHGGELTVWSTLGEGSTFCITLPR